MEDAEKYMSKCPNGCGNLVHASADNVTFFYGCDDVATVDLIMKICPKCGYTGLAWCAS